MRQPRSADPWSSFLDPQDGSHHERHASSGIRGGRVVVPEGEGPQALPEPSRRVLALLQDHGGEVLVRQLAEQLDLGLLEVADAIRILRARHVVDVMHSGPRETVRVAVGYAHQAGD
jgi:hypothetical protein